MCLVAFSQAQHPRYAWVLASNRDEFFAREAVPLAWWPGGELLGGRDMQGGGSWLLLNREGSLALVTNVREPGRDQPGLPSRGELPLRALQGESPAQLAAEPRNGFNLLVADLRRGQAQWASNRPQGQGQALGPGLYGLSNAALDTPWPKLERLKTRLAAALQTEALEDRLFAALAEAAPVDDALLPATGLSLERERQLSSAFIRVAGPDGQAVYGTRCSTLVIAERLGGGLRIKVIERRFGPNGGIAGETEQGFSVAAA